MKKIDLNDIFFSHYGYIVLLLSQYLCGVVIDESLLAPPPTSVCRLQSLRHAL